MPFFTRIVFFTLFLVSFFGAQAQNIGISYTNPPSMSVCEDAQFTVTVQNNTGATISIVRVGLTFPTGIEYRKSTVSNAVEFNTTNLGAPKFALPDMTAGQSITFSFTLHATCDAREAINNGAVFTNHIKVDHTTGTQQLTTLAYIVETGLLLITSVNPAAVTGTTGDVITRTITIRNTRQGAIRGLQFSDQHTKGATFSLNGITGQTPSVLLYKADIPGSYFTAFGDGDDLFEFNEQITLTQIINLVTCEQPSATIPSQIIIGWGCDNEICQADSIEASITVLPPTDNPNLEFTSTYALPTDQCANIPAVQEFTVKNTGPVSAPYANVLLVSGDTERLGIDSASVEINSGSGWVHLSPNGGTPLQFNTCGGTYFGTLNVKLPEIEPGATLKVRFSTYFCQPECANGVVFLGGVFNYPKLCPANSFINGNFEFSATPQDTLFESEVKFDIGTCLQDSTSYTFSWKAKSGRLKQNTGYVQFVLDLPWGLYWDPACLPKPEGKSPVLVDIDTIPNFSTTVRLVYKLPFNADSIFGNFCLYNICKPPDQYEPGYSDPLGSGTAFTLYPTEASCEPCFSTVHSKTVFSPTTDAPTSCSVSACDLFKIIQNFGCTGDGGGGSPSSGLSGTALVSYDVKRLNVGLRDDNDDQKVDLPVKPADPSKIRLDRFLPGDTMRADLRFLVTDGAVEGIKFRLFNEAWASDFGLNDGDEFDLSTGTPILAGRDSVTFIGGKVRIKLSASGQVFECPVAGPNLQADRRYFKIARPNIKPDEIIDEMVSMFDEYTILFDDLAAAGCLPGGLQLSVGDSLIFIADYKLKFNFTPNSVNFPPLINFRNTVCSPFNFFAWKTAGCLPPPLLQYSGFREIITQPLYSIQPCTDAVELSPYRYTMRIARENLFTNEIRPLGHVLKYEQSLPASAPVKSVNLNFLRLQETTNLLVNQPLAFSQSGGFFSPDLSGILTGQLDEGYAFELSSKFGPICNYNGSDTLTTQMTIRYPNVCFHKPLEEIKHSDNPNSYINGSANLVLLPTDTILTLSSSDFDLDFTLVNTAGVDAPFTWLALVSDGNLEDVQILSLPSQQPVPFVAGVFQMGTFASKGESDFRLVAKSKTCKSVKITFVFGWDCDPVANPQANSCGQYERTVELRPLNPELDLIIKEPDEVPMCAPSDYFEFEIYNAQEGRAKNVIPSIVLPPGFTVVANSSEYSYPSGGTYLPLGNPTALPGNIYQWNPQAVNNLLNTEGLADINQEPLNAIKIRFKIIANCGVVSNTQPIFGAEALLPCGATSNVLRKPGRPILLSGLEPSYGATASLFAASGSGAECGGEIKLDATVQLDGPAGDKDSIFVVLPPGITYVSGSYQPGDFAPAGPPQVLGSLIRLPLPPGLVAGQLLKFSFIVRYNEPAGCDNKFVALQVRESVQLYCQATGSNCNSYVATGESLLPLEIKNPELNLKEFNPVYQNNSMSFTAALENTGQGTAGSPVVLFYYDQNKNGKIDAGDPRLDSLQFNINVPAGTTTGISGNLNLTPDKLCNLIALIPGEENCACADREFPLNGNLVVSTAIGRCVVTPVVIGVDSLTGHTYQWVGTGLALSCTQCAHTTYTPGPNVQTGDLITVVLMDKSGDCTIERRFDIQYGAVQNTSASFTICKGESLQLAATPGGTYQWSGPGITNPTAGIQTVTPLTSGNYTATVTFAGPCTGTNTFNVTVLNSDSLNYGNIVACKSLPPEIFGAIRTEPGLYVQNLKKINGCDSVVYVRLDFVPDVTGESVPLCKGSQVQIWDTIVKSPGVVCRVYDSAFGCDSTHCVTINEVEPLMLPDTTVGPYTQGESIPLDVYQGYQSYNWTPAIHLDCYNCPIPKAVLDTSTTYTVTFKDLNGCEVGVTYRVLVFPPCSENNLRIPNAFTPNGDSVNDVFEAVPHEGFEVVHSLTVYNRWGEKVFEGGGSNVRWDGTVDGKQAPSDVYIWVLEVDCSGSLTPIKGQVTLLR